MGSTGVIANIQRFSLHDGGGVRTTVFFKGCPLRCKWCHNPEMLAFGPSLKHDKARCAGCHDCVRACPTGALLPAEQGLIYHQALCDGCGACVRECPWGALDFVGTEMTVQEVLKEVLADASLYQKTGGGVTVSGGEPTAQAAFCLELAGALKERGIHTALDTCGFCDAGALLALARAVDLVLYDVKHMDDQRHRELTGVGNLRILENLRLLDQNGINLEVRVPVIPGLNDGEENMLALARFLGELPSVRRVTLLAYHALGRAKIFGFDGSYGVESLVSPAKDRMAALAAQMGELSGKAVGYR